MSIEAWRWDDFVPGFGMGCSIPDEQAEPLPGRDDPANGVTARQDDAAMVCLCWGGAGRVKIWTRAGDQNATAGWTGCSLRGCGDASMALPAELVGMVEMVNRPVHTLRLHRHYETFTQVLPEAL